jgi:hypothetical protein
MHSSLRVLVLVIASTVMVSGGRVLAAGGPEATDLNGAEVVPGPGDPDGSGFAEITLNPGRGDVCWDISVADIDTPTAAHIHQAPAGQAGPVVVTLTPPATVPGSSTGCTKANRDLVRDILQNPDLYYVDVHTDDFPNGAIRGQLGRRGEIRRNGGYGYGSPLNAPSGNVLGILSALGLGGILLPRRRAR